MGNNKLDQRFYPEVYQAVAGNNYTVYAYLNDGSVRELDVEPLIKKGGIFKKIEDEKVFKKYADRFEWDSCVGCSRKPE